MNEPRRDDYDDRSRRARQVFFMTAGGVSKASKGINLSEDIFAGYNGTIRGGQVRPGRRLAVDRLTASWRAMFPSLALPA